MSFVRRKMTGRCCNGAERDGGFRSHLVDIPENENGFHFQKAVCGAKPGKRGNGWSDYDELKVTCPKCLLKIQKLEELSK